MADLNQPFSVDSNMRKIIYFDIDDTLYDQMKPFAEAFETVFGHLKLDIPEMYKLSRYYSDLVFHETAAGAISLDAMHIFRIKSALQHAGVSISDDEAKRFQHRYSQNQKTIKLDKVTREILAYLTAKNIELGIITNGPAQHQRSKINQLGLTEWILEKNIYISSEIGIAKPDKRIFERADGEIGHHLAEYIYIGDSFENDVVGAKMAKWTTIWLNRRKKVPTSTNISSDYEVATLKELFELIQKLVQ